MPSNKRVFVSYVFLLVFLAGCGKKPAPSRTSKSLKTIPQIFDNVFLDSFTEGWIFSFLHEESSAYLREMITSDPGWQAFFDGDWPQAITSFRASDTAASKTGLIRALLQRSQLFRDSYTAALLYQKRFLGYRQKHVKLVKPSVYLIFYLGKVRFLSGDYPKAIADLSHFLQKKTLPRFKTRAQVLLGAAHYLNGDIQKAESAWDQAKAEAENDRYFKSEWGFVQGYLGRNLTKALLRTRDAWLAVKDKTDPDKNYFLFNLMYLKLLNGQLEEALSLAATLDWQAAEHTEIIEQKLSLMFYNPFHLRFLSSLDEALCEKVIESADASPYHDFFAGQLYLRRGDYSSSESAWQDFIESDHLLDIPAAILSSHNSKEDFLLAARFSLGEVFFRQDKPQKARKLWQETFSTYQNNPLTWLHQARIEADYLHQWSNAKKTAQMALVSSQRLKTSLSEQDTFSLNAEQQRNFALFLPFYLQQYKRSFAQLFLDEGQVSEGLRILAETTDKQVGYNISSENQPRFLLALAQAYYRQNRFNEVVGIYFSLLKVFPELKQNYETIKSVYATTTDTGETPR